MNTKNLLLGIFVLLTIVFASLTVVEYEQIRQLQTTTTTSMGSIVKTYSGPTTCRYPGQPAGMSLRVLFDSTNSQVSGAQVTVTHNPGGCTPQSVQTFTTNSSTEWYPLDSSNGGNNSILVLYSGRSYNLAAQLRPVSMTCATIFIPSDKTNITISEFQTTCT